MTHATDDVTREPSGGTHRVFGAEPRLVRQADATRVLWGDEVSGQVSDLVYGRGERLSAVSFTLGPGHWFGTSDMWKPLYDQHRFYFVAAGSLAIHDPETGQVAVASAGSAITWRGARYHFGYNTGPDDVVVLDWFAPPDRGVRTPEIETMPDKRSLGAVVGGRYDLLGQWPDRRPEILASALRDGDIATVGPDTALPIVQGTRRPMIVSILSSSSVLTAGTFFLAPGRRSEPEQHPGDEVVFATAGRLNVLVAGADWFELDPLDCLYIPGGMQHEYWSYGSRPAAAVFCVAPHYR
jgi:quercetin dioxygenase-like cupin family protein